MIILEREDNYGEETVIERKEINPVNLMGIARAEREGWVRVSQ